MEFKTRKVFLPIIMLSCFLFICALGLSSQEKISRPNEYSGYSTPQWESFTRKAAYVTMPDGVKIAVDAFLPSGFKGEGKTPTRFPVIMQYTPYHRSMFDPFVRNTFELYSTMRKTNPSRIMIRPLYYQGISAPFAKLLGIEDRNPNDPALFQQLATESLRWYDRWLKGIDNGIDKELPVLIYVMNGEAVLVTEYGHKMFTPGGFTPPVGERFKNPDLAKTLRCVAEEGPEYFTKGGWAKEFVKKANELG